MTQDIKATFMGRWEINIKQDRWHGCFDTTFLNDLSRSSHIGPYLASLNEDHRLICPSGELIPPKSQASPPKIQASSALIQVKVTKNGAASRLIMAGHSCLRICRYFNSDLIFCLAYWFIMRMTQVLRLEIQHQAYYFSTSCSKIRVKLISRAQIRC